ncbi:hypothetical protein GCM10010307_07970 [Streptomyces vastus]|uniref:Uncharacterized protein n=1 Tax=Streptomyces vastus TaxID=285451 RepID=A0ABP6CMD2_9ACTN
MKPLDSAPEYVRFWYSARYAQDDADSPPSLSLDEVQATDMVTRTADSCGCRIRACIESEYALALVASSGW